MSIYDKEINSSGSVTVEAALLYPTIILIIVYIIFVGIIQYQKVYLKTVTDKAITLATLSADNPNSEFTTGLINKNKINDNKIYVMQNNFNDVIHTRTEEYISDQLSRFSILNINGPVSVNTKIDNYVIYKRIRIKVKAKYKLPVKKLFGLNNGYITLNAESAANMYDTTGMINNTDMITDTLERFGMQGSVEQFISKIIKPVKKFKKRYKNK